MCVELNVNWIFIKGNYMHFVAYLLWVLEKKQVNYIQSGCIPLITNIKSLTQSNYNFHFIFTLVQSV
jgi:hypothetical protein